MNHLETPFLKVFVVLLEQFLCGSYRLLVVFTNEFQLFSLEIPARTESP
jgi:hypothetical protein